MARPRQTLIQKGAQTGFESKLDLYCLTREEARQTRYGDNVPLFQIITPLLYRSKILGGVIEIPSAPDAFVTDLGSIPWWLWSFFMSPDDYDISYPSVVHDYLYDQLGDLGHQVNLSVKQINRATADGVLREAMASVGAPAWKQFLVYQAVRWFGPKW